MKLLALVQMLSDSKVHYGFNKKNNIDLDGGKLDPEVKAYIVNHKKLINDFLKSRQFIDLELDHINTSRRGSSALDFLFIESGGERETPILYRSFLINNMNLIFDASVLISLFVRYTDGDMTSWEIGYKGQRIGLDTSKYTNQSTIADVMNSISSLLREAGDDRLDSIHLVLNNAETNHVLAMNISIIEGHAIATMKYDAQFISENTVERIVGQYQTYLSSIVEHPEAALYSHSYLSSGELRKIKRWAGTTARYPIHETIYDLFEQQVHKTPDDIAVIYEDNQSNVFSISYIDLLCSVDDLAAGMMQSNLSNKAIGYYGERSIYTVIVMLAALKSGNIYVPLDLSYSKEQLQYIIEDAHIEYTFTTNRHMNDIANHKTVVMDEKYIKQASSYEQSLLSSKSSLDKDCLIMYTSGSTGEPKGVIHKQIQLLNRFNWLWSKYPFQKAACMGQRTSMNYMPSMWEFFGGLLKGAPTVILADAIVKDPNKLVQAIARHQISHITVVPSLLKRILESPEDKVQLSTIQLCITAGEPLTLDLLNLFKETVPQATLLNDFGATEVNGVLYVDSKSKTKLEGKLPGFKPIRNAKVYLLDSELNLTGIGVLGELHIGGLPLATGYLNNAEANETKFINNPFKDNSGPRLYKMGDYGRYLPDGSIEIVGRRDHQVKIRGIKIELSGVERVMEQHEAIAECAAFVKEIRQGVSRLYSVIVIKNDLSVTDEQLYAFLKEKVADAMIPSSFIRVERLPRTPNGKIDRRKLMMLTEQNNRVQPAVPVSAHTIVEQLVSIAAATLSVDSALIENWKKFYAVGFDSLTIVDFLNVVNKRFAISLAITDLYDRSSIDELAAYIYANHNVILDSIPESSAPASASVSTPLITPQSTPEEVEFEPEIQLHVAQEKVQSAFESRPTTVTHTSIKNMLAALAAQVLKVDISLIEHEKKYYALGFDSLTIVDFLNATNEQFGTNFSVSDLYDYSSIHELSEYLAGKDNIHLIQSDREMANSVQSSAYVPDEHEHENKNEARNKTKKIAIIGLACKYSGANSAEEYWDNLKNGVDSIQTVPAHRWSINDYYDPDMKQDNKTVSKWGGFVSDMDRFDADFFSITPIESENMDPQQRICLEECYHALEDAGYAEHDLSNRSVGVFIGARPGDYMDIIKEGRSAPNPYSLMGNDFAILAARISYFLNLKGPCLSLDTACSSSLVAIHLAARSILNGECEMALAGGICIMSTPDLYLTSSKLGMLSPDGKCKAFDNRANGFVPGEGAGFVVLKELDQAIADHDQIYGVIAASGVNQDGKTNGITAPSALSQTNLLKAIYDDHEIDPDSIDYIETHGTGTKLGDPIEIKALSEVFGEAPGAKQRRPIGSVKTNIGHTIAAAGVAGVIKVLLSLKHNLIPPTLHFEKANEHIDFKNSPFFVNTSLQEWRPKPTPRKAAVSSFGFSGTNSHVVIEECIHANDRDTSTQPYYLIPLSAKSQASLLQKIHQLGEWLRGSEGQSIGDIAYTLGVGRSHFDERMAFVVDSKEELQALLKKGHNPVNTERTEKDAHCDHMIDFILTSDIDRNVYKQHLESLKASYLRGDDVNWRKLYQNSQAKKISMPTYPFEKKRFWIENSPEPQFHHATSTKHGFFECVVKERQKVHFTAVLNNRHELVKDHQINDSIIVPGTFYVEMVFRALETQHVFKDEVMIEHFNLIQSIRLEEQDTSITLSINTSAMTFEVSSGEDLIASGSYSPAQNHFSERFELQRFIAHSSVSYDQQAIYEQHHRMHCHYGSTYQVVQHVDIKNNELLARIDFGGDRAYYDNGILHPVLLDGALHAVVGFESFRSSGNQYLPFSIGQVRVHKTLTAPCYSHIQIVENNEANAYIKCKIKIYEETGVLLAEIGDFVLKAIPERTSELLFYTQQWKEKVINPHQDPGQETVILFDVGGSHYEALARTNKVGSIVLVKAGSQFEYIQNGYQVNIHNAEDYNRLLDDFQKRSIEFSNVIYIPAIQPQSKSPVDKARDVAHPLLLLSKAFMKVSGGRIYNLLGLIHAKDRNQYPFYAGLGPCMQTIGLEHPAFRFRTLAHDWTEIDGERTIEELFTHSSASEVKYHDSVRMERELQTAAVESSAYRDFDGVYVITGGLGGIGIVVARYLSQYPSARIVLLGRSPFDNDTARILAPFKRNHVVYRRCDLAVESEVEEVLTSITSEMGPVKGIFHCAGVIKDRLMFNKEWRDFEEVIKPKIAGTVYLSKYAKDLDFMVLFSSVTATFGNKGQSDYAYANGFMDYFAGLSENVISINWPLWLSGGMQLSESELHKLQAEKGWEGLPDDIALEALFSAVSSRYRNIGVLYGREPRLTDREADRNIDSSSVLEDTKRQLVDTYKIKETIAEIIADVTKMPAKQVMGKKSFEQFDFNSLMIMELTGRLEKVFGPLSSTLFYEYNALDELVDYFIHHHQAVIAERYIAKEKDADTTVYERNETYSLAASPSAFAAKESLTSKLQDRADAIRDGAYSGDIAIIGVAGRYPQANNLNALWDNLKNGRNCITEIPADRWDWKMYYTEDKKAYGGIYTKWGGFIEDVDKFDPLFFGISPREAEQMDPQERLFLETVYASIEDAGYTPEHLSSTRKVGVYAGVMNGDYSTGASFWSIANRVSYVMNFQGPSMAIDTACSSSLVAIHLAAESLYSGICECAIAGGVNLIISPYHYKRLSGKTMLTPDHVCKPFGADADGFVDAEGVGAVVLKPLAAAERDGDHIYGMIKGSMINAGGKTNGYTVPNPNMQRQLTIDALRRANVDARTISYVEAHGTGTELGDPIEIAGLTGAFAESTSDTQFCAIGSIKSNIGHLESAAGIAGLTKVLLQMKHGQVVPSLHSATLNPRIDFHKTPFVVQQELTEWSRPMIDNQPVPRRAGLSSFGAGGANAHVIIEEYIYAEGKREERSFTEQDPVIIVLSAKSEERLREQVSNLLEATRMGQLSNEALSDIAYTLQVGRAALEERLAMTVTSLEQMANKLRDYLENMGEADSVSRGTVQNDKALGAVLGDDEDIQFAVEAWINKRKYGKLLELWVIGLDVDWGKLYEGSKPKRVSLPTYPFARERYWLSEREAGKEEISTADHSVNRYVHPLLHRNTSNLEEQRFTSIFTGEEFFLRDHVVRGLKILPGAAYLEMVRMAIRESVPRGEAYAIRLKHMVWSRPIAVNGKSEEIHIGIYPEENSEIGYEIYTEGSKREEETVVHCQGRAAFIMQPYEAINIPAMQAECSHHMIAGTECYEQFRALGIDYGMGHQGIKQLYIGDNKVLAKLAIPEAASAAAEHYVLHPGMIDSAIQATIGLLIDGGTTELERTKARLPFAIEELEIIGHCDENMWAVIRTGQGSHADHKIDIDLCDDNGVIQVRMKNIAFRALEAESEVTANVNEKE